jgi:hypothetical protein
MKLKRLAAALLSVLIISSAGQMSVAADWEEADGNTYYTEDGTYAKGFTEIDGETYYFKSATGAMATGWLKINGDYYYFSKTTGKMLHSNTYKIDGSNYKFDTDGKYIAGAAASSGIKTGDYSKDTGKVLSVYSYNEEVGDNIENYYLTRYKLPSGVKLNNVVIHLADDYRRGLTAELAGNSKSRDVDIFVTESGDADIMNAYAMPLSDLGVKKGDLKDLYSYTLDLSTDKNGRLLGLMPTGAPGVIAYRRSIALDVLGTDSPTKVAAAFKDLKTFEATAKKMDAAGYFAAGAPEDIMRLYADTATTPLVSGNTLKVPASWENWAKASKRMYDNGYFANDRLWDSEWMASFDENTFAYSAPRWMVDFVIKTSADESYGDWAIATPAKPYSYGGYVLSVAKGADNAYLAKDVIVRMATDKAIQLDTVKSGGVSSVSKSATKSLINSGETDDFLGGQNSYEIYDKAAANLKINSEGLYYTDSLIFDYIEEMNSYITGKSTYSAALERFYDIALSQYPELKIK